MSFCTSLVGTQVLNSDKCYRIVACWLVNPVGARRDGDEETVRFMAVDVNDGNRQVIVDLPDPRWNVLTNGG